MTSVSWGWLLLLLIPTITYMFLKTSSMAAGLIISLLLWLILIAKSESSNSLKPSSLQLACLILGVWWLTIWSLLAWTIIESNDVARFLSSLVLLTFIWLSAIAVANALATQNGETLAHTANIGLYILGFIAFSAAVGVPGLGPDNYEKPLVIFTEYSHYALAAMPFLIFNVCISNNRRRILILSLALICILKFQSTTGLAGILLAGLLLGKRNNILAALCATGLFIALADINYYTDRLDFSSESNNLSALVLLSGWKRALLNFQETYGVGVGFQQFGITGNTDDIMSIIQSISGEQLNLNDGGSIAAKLIGETGIFGVTLILSYLILFIKVLFNMRQISANNGDITDEQVLSALQGAFILSGALDIFVRGQGYFSVGPFLLLVGIILRISSHRIFSNLFSNK